jgi:hypothetical protein
VGGTTKSPACGSSEHMLWKKAAKVPTNICCCVTKCGASVARFDPELLQLLRQEIALFGGGARLRTNVSFVEPDALQSHLQRLLMGGELEADCTMTPAGLDIDVRGLSHYGVHQMRSTDRDSRRRR